MDDAMYKQESVQTVLFDAQLDTGADTETGLHVVVNIDEMGSHLDATPPTAEATKVHGARIGHIAVTFPDAS